MKQNKKWSMRIASFCLAGACLCGGAVLAAGGDESDPLVTLSYLTQTVTPNILKQVDEQAAKRQSELLAQLNTAIADYKMAVEGGGASGGTSASYSVVTLTSGQTLALGVGAAVLWGLASAGSGSGMLTEMESPRLTGVLGLAAEPLICTSPLLIRAWILERESSGRWAARYWSRRIFPSASSVVRFIIRGV